MDNKKRARRSAGSWILHWAPRLGFEPRTYRLTAGRSTVELSGNSSGNPDADTDVSTSGTFSKSDIDWSRHIRLFCLAATIAVSTTKVPPALAPVGDDIAEAQPYCPSLAGRLALRRRAPSPVQCRVGSIPPAVQPRAHPTPEWKLRRRSSAFP